MNNSLKAELEYIYKDKVCFLSDVYGIKLTMKAPDEKGYLLLELSGIADDVDLENLFFKTYSLMFIYLGFFPKMLSLSINGIKKNIEEYAGKYFTSGKNIKDYTTITKLEENAFSESVYDKYEKLQQSALFSMQYLISDDYENVSITHKLVLLLQTLDGLCNSLRVKEANYSDNIIELCDNYFFLYDRKYNCRILAELEQVYKVVDYEVKATDHPDLYQKRNLSENEKKFCNACIDTRHWYSHFLSDNKRKNRLTDGLLESIYFHILFYAIRVKLNEYLIGMIEEDRIKRYYYVYLFDYIILNYNNKITNPEKQKLARVELHKGQKIEFVYQEGTHENHRGTYPNPRQRGI